MKQYLVVYNTLSSLAWLAVLARTLLLLAFVQPDKVHLGVADFLRAVQTASLLDIVHIALGLVRSPLLTTCAQIASRLLIVWGAHFLFPGTAAATAMFPAMVIAWSMADATRYAYYAFHLQSRHVPYPLVWLRYNAFLLLYPIGVAGEMWQIYRSLPTAGAVHPMYPLLLRGILCLYPPGFVVPCC